MSKIYNFKTDTETISMISMDYMQECLSQIINLLRAHMSDTDNAHKIIDLEDPNKEVNNLINNTILKSNPDIIDIDISNRINGKIHSANIIQDASHRMITDAQIKLFRSKPSLKEVQDNITASEINIKNNLQSMFAQLINDQNALEKLKKFIQLINDNKSLNQLSDILIDNITQDDLNNHISSNKHVTLADRKALNILIELMTNGIIDQISKGTINRAINADNAKTINGYSIDQLQNRHIEDIIYGIKDNIKFNSFADKLIDGNLSEIDITNNHNIGLKSGNYIIDKEILWDIKHPYIIIQGSDDTIFDNKKSVSHNTIKLYNMKINNLQFISDINNKLIISIENELYCENCKFINCHIKINNAFVTILKHNIFTNCTWEIVNSQQLIITENFCNNSQIPNLLGNDYIIKNNIRT